MARTDPYGWQYDPYDTRRTEYEFANRSYPANSPIGAVIALFLLLGFVVFAIAFGSREPGPTTGPTTVTPPVTQPAPATTPRAPNG
jgi:hypothetical protein